MKSGTAPASSLSQLKELKNPSSHAENVNKFQDLMLSPNAKDLHSSSSDFHGSLKPPNDLKAGELKISKMESKEDFSGKLIDSTKTKEIPIKQQAETLSNLLVKANTGITQTVKKLREVEETVNLVTPLVSGSSALLGKIEGAGEELLTHDLVKEVASKILVGAAGMSKGQEVRVSFRSDVLPQTEVRISEDSQGKIQLEFVTQSSESATWLQKNVQELQRVIGPDKIESVSVVINEDGKDTLVTLPLERLSKQDKVAEAKLATSDQSGDGSASQDDASGDRSKGMFLFEDQKEDA